MAALVYILCTLISASCSVFLLKSYAETKFRLLFWSGLCFAGIAAGNVLLMSDKLLFPTVDLTTMRLAVGLLALLPLLYGLVFDE